MIPGLKFDSCLKITVKSDLKRISELKNLPFIPNRIKGFSMSSILFAEDDESLFDLVKLQFKDNIDTGEFTFIHAKNGQEALNVLGENPQIDLLVSDINMPEITGLELLNIVKVKYPLLKTIIMTAYGDKENVRTAMNQGAFDFIIKPFNKNDLTQTIKKALVEVTRFKKMIQELQSAREANRLKNEFIANITHELLTPMHGILSFSEFGCNKTKHTAILDQKKQEKCNTYFKGINTSARRLLDLINDILKLTLLESGQITFNMVKNDIDHLIQLNCSNLEGMVKEKAIAIKYSKHDSVSLCLDASQISEVIFRIMQNAVKFSPEHSEIEIQVLVQPETKAQRKCLKVSISDQGPGVPENEVKTIFEKFSQSSRTKTGAGGRGVGLAICKEIINKHQGEIWVKNNPTAGATFFIELPFSI
jgi:signal transduction histidine kinase